MNFIIDTEQYLKAKAAWSKRQDHSSAEMIIYNILRGFDATRGFTPISNPRKLANGMTPMLHFMQNSYACRLMIAPLVHNRWVNDEQHKQNVERQKKAFEAIYGLELSDELREKILTGLKAAGL
jgi:uncharacterized protein YhfF